MWPSGGAAPTVTRWRNKMAPRGDRIDRCLGSMATSVYDNWSRSIELAPCPGRVEARLFTVSVVTAFLSARRRARGHVRARDERRAQNPSARTAHATRAASGACWTVLLVRNHVRWWDSLASLGLRSSRADSSNIIVLVIVSTTWIN